MYTVVFPCPHGRYCAPRTEPMYPLRRRRHAATGRTSNSPATEITSLCMLHKLLLCIIQYEALLVIQDQVSSDRDSMAIKPDDRGFGECVDSLTSLDRSPETCTGLMMHPTSDMEGGREREGGRGRRTWEDDNGYHQQDVIIDHSDLAFQRHTRHHPGRLALGQQVAGCSTISVD
ncbi:hypothetical protein J6590_079781 [Homalodisca vitripennis]|nr:hypothetical protein J6590_079781 [Homalodisca vitripennis]